MPQIQRGSGRHWRWTPLHNRQRRHSLGRRHLDWTLRTYVAHYNRQRPHRAIALALASPLAQASITVAVNPRDVRRRDLLVGLIYEYHGLAA